MEHSTKSSNPTLRPRESARAGFTILELFVVLVVAALLLSLLVPGIRHAQEAARRVQCQNNIKQVGLALHNYHDLYDCFPPGYIARNVTPRDPAEAETGTGYAWGAMLLPFLDQVPVYRTLDFSQNSTQGPVNIGWFRCNSDPDATGASMVGVFGFGSLTLAPGAPAGPGIFYRNSHVPSFEVKDGLSNTFMIGERAAVHDFEPGLPPITAGAHMLAAPPGEFRDAGASDRALYREGPGSFVLGTVGQDAPWEVHATHCRTNHIASFSSRHPGGANFLLGDGALRFLSSDIDYATYRRLGQRSDGEAAALPAEW